MSETTLKAPPAQERVLQLAREINELAASDLALREFFTAFIERVVAALGARAGAVWLLDGHGRLDLCCEVGLAGTDMSQSPPAIALNQRLLQQTLVEGGVRCIAPDDKDGQGLPLTELLILGALRRSKNTIGVFEIFQRSDSPRQARAAYLQFVEQMTAHACRYLERQENRKASAAATRNVEPYHRFAARLHSTLRSREVAATAATEARLLTGCDRVSVAVMRGGRPVIIGVSGQATINRRSKLVRHLENLFACVLPTRRPLIYAGSVKDVAPQIEEPLAAFVEESHSRMVAVLPLLMSNSPQTEGEEQARSRKPPTIVGGMLFEQVADSQPHFEMLEQAEMIAGQTAIALFNARTHERVFLGSLRRVLGHPASWLEGRRLWKLLVAIACLAIVAAVLTFVPYTYRVEGDGRLMPVMLQGIFAPIDGDVVEIFVNDGDRVAKDDQLLLLRNDELRKESLATRNKLHELTQRLFALQAQLDTATDTAAREDQVRLQSEIVKAQVEIRGEQQHLETLTEQEAQLTAKSPIEGVVTAFQIDRLLRNRPVRRGDLLLEVAGDRGDWRLELEIEDRRMGHLLQALEQAGPEGLPVEFVLATEIETTYQGRVEQIATRANPSRDKGIITEVLVKFDGEPPAARRVGAEVTAKISCSTSSLGYVLFGDVIEFVQRHLWL